MYHGQDNYLLATDFVNDAVAVDKMFPDVLPGQLRYDTPHFGMVVYRFCNSEDFFYDALSMID